MINWRWERTSGTRPDRQRLHDSRWGQASWNQKKQGLLSSGLQEEELGRACTGEGWKTGSPATVSPCRQCAQWPRGAAAATHTSANGNASPSTRGEIVSTAVFFRLIWKEKSWAFPRIQSGWAA